MKERWRWIPGFRGRYSVSSLGRVRSKARTFIRTNGVPFTVKGKILKTQINKKRGYRQFSVVDYGKQKHVALKLHVVTCLAFHGPKPTPLHEVNHIDGNKLNNRADNLEWSTRPQNIQHSIRLGLRHPEQNFPWYGT